MAHVGDPAQTGCQCIWQERLQLCQLGRVFFSLDGLRRRAGGVVPFHHVCIAWRQPPGQALRECPSHARACIRSVKCVLKGAVRIGQKLLQTAEPLCRHRHSEWRFKERIVKANPPLKKCRDPLPPGHQRITSCNGSGENGSNPRGIYHLKTGWHGSRRGTDARNRKGRKKGAKDTEPRLVASSAPSLRPCRQIKSASRKSRKRSGRAKAQTRLWWLQRPLLVSGAGM